MAVQYQNFKEFLETVDCRIDESIRKDFIDNKNKRVRYTCVEGHLNEIQDTSFVNKRTSFNKGKITNMCSQCVKLEKNKDDLETIKKKIFEKHGHTVKEFVESKNGHRHVMFKCGNCGETSENSVSVLGDINKGGCDNCYRIKRKKEESDIISILEKFGMKLVSYEDNKNAVVKCKCGDEYKTAIHDIVRGKNCMKCGAIKRRGTNLKQYGTENVFASEHGKQKIIETNLKKRGVKYPMQDPSILKKAMETNMKLYNVSFSFHTIAAIKNQRLAIMKKFGVEYPLQSEVVMEKIRNTFLKKIGYEYPLQSPVIRNAMKQLMFARYGVEYYSQTQQFREFMLKHRDEFEEKRKKTCMDRYGVDCYFQTKEFRDFMLEHQDEFEEKRKKTCMDRYGVDCYFKSSKFISNISLYQARSKETCLDKYGVEYYVKSTEFISNIPLYRARSKETCLDKYGVEYPMQCSEIFSKFLKSSFSKKEYVFPSGRIEYVMGYENRCIDDILNLYSEENIVIETRKIPKIHYKKINKDGKEQSAVYYPDILIGNENKLIEVKSIYTYEKDLEKNTRKFIACNESGYNIDCYVYDSKKLSFILRYVDGNVERINK